MQNIVNHEISILPWPGNQEVHKYINECLSAWKFFVRIQRLFKEDEEGEERGCMGPLVMTEFLKP